MRKVLSIMVSILLMVSLASTSAALPLDATPERPLLVTVVGQDSAPLSGAVVQLLTPGRPDVITARTNQLGQAHFTLPDGFSFWLRAWADGHAVVEQPYVPLSDGSAVTLRASAATTSLVGIVTDDRGNPVPEAQVTIWRGNLGLYGTTATDTAGVYRIEGLRTGGGYTLQIEAAGFHPFTQSNLTLEGGVRNQVDAELTPAAGRVTGEIVHGRTKEPLSLVTVELILSGWGVVDRTQTDDAGYFTLEAPETSDGTYQIRLWASGYEVLTSAAFTVTPGSWTDFSGANRFELNPLYGELSGIVLDESGSPLADVEVQLQRSGLGTIRTARTDENGFYRFTELPAGTYRARALPNDYLIHGDSGWITIGGGDRLSGDISANNPETATYGPSSIIGTVRDHLGEPVSGATVTAIRAGQVYKTTTDDQGRYRLSVEANIEDATVDPETSTGYHVTVSAPGYIPTDQQNTVDNGLSPSLVDVQAGASNRADFTLYPSYGAVGGRVMDNQGRPLAGITVVLREEGTGEVRRVQTDALGRYRFPNLEVSRQARYLPVVIDSQYVTGSILTDGTVSEPMALEPGTSISTTLTTRSRTGYIRGIVKAGADDFAEGAEVTVTRPADGQSWSGTVSELGTYSIPVTVRPNAQYLVRVSQKGAGSGSALTAVSLGDNDGVTVNLQSVPPASVTGVVYTAAGTPAANVLVVLWEEGNSSYTVTTSTDRNGRYRFENLKPGVRYMVAASNSRGTWSTLTPGDPIITPLVTPAPGQAIWADIQTRR